MAIGARIVLRDGRGLRCVLWYVCAHSYEPYSEEREGGRKDIPKEDRYSEMVNGWLI